MSEQLRAFVEAIARNADLRSRVAAAASEADVIALAKAQGITLTGADLLTAVADGSDISDADLEAASGGEACIMTRWLPTFMPVGDCRWP